CRNRRWSRWWSRWCRWWSRSGGLLSTAGLLARQGRLRWFGFLVGEGPLVDPAMGPRLGVFPGDPCPAEQRSASTDLRLDGLARGLGQPRGATSAVSHLVAGQKAVAQALAQGLERADPLAAFAPPDKADHGRDKLIPRRAFTDAGLGYPGISAETRPASPDLIQVPVQGQHQQAVVVDAAEGQADLALPVGVL